MIGCKKALCFINCSSLNHVQYAYMNWSFLL